MLDLNLGNGMTVNRRDVQGESASHGGLDSQFTQLREVVRYSDGSMA